MRKVNPIIAILCLMLMHSMHAVGQNYAEVLQKSMFFFECQRSGPLPANNRVNWRGNSGMNDGADVSRDLRGGWYDAGDHVKFGFPMAFTATALAWGAIEFEQGYQSSGQLPYLKSNLRWVNDYFIKCHTAPNELWGQVGNGGADHAWWGSAEVMQMARPSYKIDATRPGSDLAGETAAAMAAASIVFASDDPAYSTTLLTHAKQLFNFADTHRGRYTGGIPDATAYYNSWSGFQDEIVWAAIWLYLATNDQTYLAKAEAEYDLLGNEGQSTDKAYKWGISWDDKSYGCYVLLAKITGKEKYRIDAERHLDYWTDGYNGGRIRYTPGGLAWLDMWGSLRYSANTSFLALVYGNVTTNTAKRTKYYNFAVSQMKYILGNNPRSRSYVCGYGVNPPVNPHHRTAHGAWANNPSGPPANNRHIIYGALVGGPGASDDYTDDRTNFTNNEVACDYNALFSGCMAKLAQDFGGTALSNFPVPETPTDEFIVEARLNSTGSQYTEYSVWVSNHTAWPSRIPSQWKYRLFVDITEGLAAGYRVADYIISANGSNITFTGLQPWDVARNIYYTEVTYSPSILIWPGGQGESTEESQVRIRLPYEAPASAWSATNDWSYQGLSGTLTSTNNIPLYVDGVLVRGATPPSGPVVPVTSVTVAPTSAAVNVGATVQLTATVLPANATNKAVTWSSSNTAIATVNANGLVTGVAAGAATITVTTLDGNRTASSSVTVSTANVPVSSVAVTPTTFSLNVGGTTQLTATISPANATNKTVSWSSSNTTVATVNATGLVTAVAIGSATITVTTQDGGRTATSTVTVTNTSIPVTAVTVSPTATSINVGATAQLTATVLPANATNKTVSWSSSNTSIATVNTTGLVTGVTAGTATITVTTQDGARTATSSITVTSSPTTCGFGTPLTSGLPTMHGSFNNVHKVGTGGPNLSNVTNFTINWNLQLNGLWQLSFNTNNGNPTWWIDLRTVATTRFNQAQPDITFINSGFPGLDGQYWVGTHNGNFVMASKTGGFTLYFSNSGTPPVCTVSSMALSSQARMDDAESLQRSVSMYPNPFSSYIHINVSDMDAVERIVIRDSFGQVVHQLTKETMRYTNFISFEDQKRSGLYIVHVQGRNSTYQFRVIKE